MSTPDFAQATFKAFFHNEFTDGEYVYVALKYRSAAACQDCQQPAEFAWYDVEDDGKPSLMCREHFQELLFEGGYRARKAPDADAAWEGGWKDHWEFFI